MSVTLVERGIHVVLLDIEGTTTPMAFVHEVLFPFARAHLRTWIRQSEGTDAWTGLEQRFEAEHGAEVARGETVPPWRRDAAGSAAASLETFALWLMDRDRKSPALKEMQGLIWEEGYQAGDLRGDVYPDVPRAMRRWRASGIDVAIYSSGSVLAQRRLFESTREGDLTPLVARFFDTSAGAKRDPASYARIAAALGHSPQHIMFISDVAGELEAASRAGYAVRLAVRPGNAPEEARAAYETVTTFDEVL